MPVALKVAIAADRPIPVADPVDPSDPPFAKDPFPVWVAVPHLQRPHHLTNSPPIAKVRT